jgi:hypothetical protein
VYVNIVVAAFLSSLWTPPMLWSLPEPAPWAAAPHISAFSRTFTTKQVHVPAALRVAANVSQSAFFPDVHHHHKYDSQAYELYRQQCEAAGAAHTGSCPASFSSAPSPAPAARGIQIKSISAPPMDDGGRRGASWPSPPPAVLVNRPASGQHAPFTHGSSEVLKSTALPGVEDTVYGENASATSSSAASGKSRGRERGHMHSGPPAGTIHKNGRSSVLERIMDQTLRDLSQLQELAGPLIRVAQSVMPAQVVAGWAGST